MKNKKQQKEFFKQESNDYKGSAQKSRIQNMKLILSLLFILFLIGIVFYFFGWVIPVGSIGRYVAVLLLILFLVIKFLINPK